MISYCLPTRDRPEELARTLCAIGALSGHDRVGGAEVVVVDNASRRPADVPARLHNGLPVKLVRLDGNLGAAARNEGVRRADPRSAWIVMLDDDSHPMDAGLFGAIARAAPDAAAITADIHTHRGRQLGGLPEVPVGCGVAYRREVYERLGGYDVRFEYYAEEYDLAAKMLLGGCRIEHDPWFRVMHAASDRGRDMNRIMHLLVRNNGWIIDAYAPLCAHRQAMRRMRRRAREIALREGASKGYARGLDALRRSRTRPRGAMPPELYDRFTGLDAARTALADAHAQSPLGRVMLAAEGKHAWVVRQALEELGVEVECNPQLGELCHHTIVIGTMSPGPMADALDRWSGAGRRVIAPWLGVRGPAGPDARLALADLARAA